MEFEQYSQKQIFEISKNPNALLERIDINVEEINNLKDKRILKTRKNKNVKAPKLADYYES